MPADLVRAQIDAVASDLHPAAVKTGMLANRDIISVVADGIHRHKLPNYVLDPVMVATSGDLLIEGEAVAAIRDKLLPLADLVTPNANEAAVLAGFPLRHESDMRRAAEVIGRMGARAVLIKGGHIREADSVTVVDVLFDGEMTTFRHSRIDTTSTHGTGCTLSAAVVAQLANGLPLRDAVASAIDFVHAALETAPGLGSGHGPLNHFAPVGASSATNSRTSS